MIRVKDFAKYEPSQSLNEIKENEDDNENGFDGSKPAIDIEIISLSSNDDDVPPAPPPSTSTKKSVRQTPIKRKTAATTKRLNSGATTPSKRKPKPPMTYKYHKISEYFAASKKSECLPLISEKMSVVKAHTHSSNNNNNNKNASAATTASTSSKAERDPPEMSDVKRYKSNLRQTKVVLRRLSIEKPVETVRKRRIQEDQSKLPEFIEYQPSGDTYFQTYDQTTYQGQAPVVEMNGNGGGDGDGNGDGDSPEKRIKIDPDRNDHSEDSNAFIAEIDEFGAEEVVATMVESSIDTRSSSNDNCSSVGSEGDISNSSSSRDSLDVENPTNVRTTSGKRTNKKLTIANTLLAKAVANRRKIECPYYKIIEHTKFAVDAFRYGDIEGVEHYFLSHFHADHYIGLKRTFNHKLYLSHITGRLVMELIKVDEQYIRYLDLDQPTVVDGVEVIALDANHCPGAVMFLFKLKTGKCILHTGDFRASADMESYPEFWNYKIDCIYLDTTYLSKSYDFITQSESILLIRKYCREFARSCTSSSGKPLIICGAYKIGKEKVWLRIAQDLNFKVWIDDERHRVMQCLQNDEINAVITRHAKDANIHILPLGSISYQFIVQYVDQFDETFSKVLAIRPSGWENKITKPNFANRISVMGVPYSEHSSYNEMERFVRFLRPKKVISTVPYSSKNMVRTSKVPDSWMNPKLEPKRQSYQPNIKDYMVKMPTQRDRIADPTIARQELPKRTNPNRQRNRAHHYQSK